MEIFQGRQMNLKREKSHPVRPSELFARGGTRDEEDHLRGEKKKYIRKRKRTHLVQTEPP